MEKSYKQIMPEIKAFIFDVDGVLTNGMVTVTTDGQLIRHMNVKDGYALKAAVTNGYKVCIISGGSNEGVRKRLANLGIEDIYLGAKDKIKQFQMFTEKYNLEADAIAYMGDDVPDYPVMRLVGLPCCPKDAVREVQQVAKYISDKKGGEGCVRDVIEQIMRVQQTWENNYDAKND